MFPRIVSYLIEAAEKFIRAPGRERAEPLPGEQSLNVIWNGTYDFLSGAEMTLIVLPVTAAILWRFGFRVTGPIVALFALGLFLSRVLTVQT